MHELRSGLRKVLSSVRRPVLVSESESPPAPNDRKVGSVAPGQWPSMPLADAAVAALPGEPLAELRDRAERQLNAVRALVLALLTTAALAYRPMLTPALRLVNVSLLVPMLMWTLGQYLFGTGGRGFLGGSRSPTPSSTSLR